MSAKVLATLIDRVSRRLDAVDTAKSLEALIFSCFDSPCLAIKTLQHPCKWPVEHYFESEGNIALRLNLENFHKGNTD